MKTRRPSVLAVISIDDPYMRSLLEPLDDELEMHTPQQYKEPLEDVLTPHSDVEAGVTRGNGRRFKD